MKPPPAEEKEADKSLLETHHLFRSPANAARLLQSIAEMEKGSFAKHQAGEPGDSSK